MSEGQGGGRLKGLLGVIEMVSVAMVCGAAYHNLFAPRPIVITPQAHNWYLFTTALGVLGGIGIAYTQWIRHRIRSDPSLAERYIDPRPPTRLKGDVSLGGDNLSPVKKWLTLIAIGLAICLGFIALVVMTTR